VTTALPPFRGETFNVLLWHPSRGAYLDMSGKGYTRDVTRAACLTADNARRLRAQQRHAVLRSKITAMTANTDFRDELTDLSEEELLRRAMQGLCARDRAGVSSWALVMDTLGLTSGAAVMLCRRLNIDPNQRTGH
jgi:hypothetical protein